MNCYSCHNARLAGNHDLVGCCYWTAIFRGNIIALRTALDHINQKNNYDINLDSESMDKEVIAFLIDILIEDYAPKPLYEGWANLTPPYNQKKNNGEMTDGCVVLDPQGCCDFHLYQDHQTMNVREEEKVVLTQ